MHEPVLLNEVVESLAVKPGGCYVDGTVGGGGHAERMFEVAGGDIQLIGIDRDADAIGRTRRRLGKYGAACRLVHGNFADIKELVAAQGMESVDGVLLDVGVSSNQLDEEGRGFSFGKDGPLDMRMDRSRGQTAAGLLKEADEEELRSLFWEFGEERQARRIARAIVRARGEGDITTTAQLAGIVEQAVGRRGSRHPATRVFQALRIAVNDELNALKEGLDGALALLREGGRMAVISFHSLEDRIVKQFFVRHEGRWNSLPAGGQAWEGETPVVKRITRKPIRPGVEETAANARARSAKLRVAEKVSEKGM